MLHPKAKNLQRAVQLKLSFIQEHFVTHFCSYSHFTSSKTAFGAGKDTQRTDSYDPSLKIQPFSSNLGNVGFDSKYDLSQTQSKIVRCIPYYMKINMEVFNGLEINTTWN